MARVRFTARIAAAAAAAVVVAAPTASEPLGLPPRAAAGTLVQAAAPVPDRNARTQRRKPPGTAGPRKSRTTPSGRTATEARTRAPGRTADPAETVRAPDSKPIPGVPSGMAAPQNRAAAPSPEKEPGPRFDEPACRGRLAAAGVGFELLPGISGAGGCGAAAPLRVSSLAAGVKLSSPATLSCRMTEALASWTTLAVVPGAERILGAKPVELLIGTTYMCRPRNHRAGAKLSEHGIANAVDLVGFKLDGRPALTFAERYEDDSAPARFLAEIRKTACDYFTTVLGPGSDEAHKVHMHVDMRRRKNDYRICQ